MPSTGLEETREALQASLFAKERDGRILIDFDVDRS
jgi:hypothetical protein